jgi:DNA-binding NtrC family response regulator
MNLQAQPKTTVVLVMASQDPALRDIRELLDELQVAVRPVASLQEFLRLIGQKQPADVVITGVSLPDGNWCDVLTSTIRAGCEARVLICAPEVDERFWSEAIWRGVHDILVAPFANDYVERAVDVRAWRPQQDQKAEPETSGDQETEQRVDTRQANPLAIALAAVA